MLMIVMPNYHLAWYLPQASEAIVQ